MFKHRRRDELLAFRTKIREFERALATASSPEEFKAINASFSENLERSLLDLQSALRDSRIESRMASVKGLLALRPDSPLAMMAAGGMVSKIAGLPTHTTLASIGAAGALSIGCDLISSWTRERTMRRNSAFAYLYNAEDAGLLRTRYR